MTKLFGNADKLRSHCYKMLLLFLWPKKFLPENVSSAFDNRQSRQKNNDMVLIKITD